MSDADTNNEDAKSVVESRRIFINNLDSYNGKNLAKYLSKCVVGASSEPSEEEGGGEEEKANGSKKENVYKICGTVKNFIDYKKPDYPHEIIKNDSKDDLFEQLKECDILIYDIIQDVTQLDEASWAINALHENIEKMNKPKVFILLSTIMTWAKSKPTDPDDPEIPFTEEEFRRRKPHPNFREHLSVEKLVLKLGKISNKKKLTTFVVCSGLVYGQEESLFHFLFKSGWHNSPELPVFGNGKNVLPAIHVNDLAAILQNIADQKPKVRYLVAVDDSKLNLKQITKAISKQLSTGKIKIVAKEDALLNKDISQSEFDMLTVDLRMEGAFIKENMQIKWHCETGFVDNIAKIIKEFKTTRNLIPFKVCILGPPGVGKSTIAQQLAKEYKVHHIHLKDVVTKALTELEKIAARAEEEANRPTNDDLPEGEEDEEEEEEGDDEGRGQDAAELEAIKESMDTNNGRLENQYLIRFVKQRLLSKPCQNQGFILDGFPKIDEQAKELFAPEDGEEESGEETGEEDQGKISKFNKLITPDIIIKLDASDEFIHRRIMNLPEKLVQDTHNTEEGLTRRLTEYRQVNNEDETVSNVFEEEFDLNVIKMAPEVIEEDKSTMHRKIVDMIKINYMKEPRNYGLTQDEKDALKRAELEEHFEREKKEREEREKRVTEETNEREKNRKEWAKKLAEIEKEEVDQLEQQSVPLRNYLMTHVMPTLTKGLIDCAQLKPQDPIDYLAEYLFKNNPQVN